MSISVEQRPWGTWKVIHEEDAATVKVLTVNPGCMLSLQSHDLRDEYWVPLESGLVAYVDDSRHSDAQLLRANYVFRIRRGTNHRLINPTAEPISVVEIINGIYDEVDIVRYHDAYGRL